jgi:hypothetical protein
VRLELVNMVAISHSSSPVLYGRIMLATIL